MHHMDARAIDAVWRFEQAVMKRSRVASKSETRQVSLVKGPLLWKDYYAAFVSPNISPHMIDWDNLSEHEGYPSKRHPVEKLKGLEAFAMVNEESCRKLCIENKKCMQYSWRRGQCRLHHTVRFGEKKEGVNSGFLMERIDGKIGEWPSCETPQWVTDEQASVLQQQKDHGDA